MSKPAVGCRKVRTLINLIEIAFRFRTKQRISFWRPFNPNPVSKMREFFLGSPVELNSEDFLKVGPDFLLTGVEIRNEDRKNL